MSEAGPPAGAVGTPRTAAGLKLRIRALVLLFIAGLVASGITAFPLRHELNFVHSVLLKIFPSATPDGGFVWWIDRVHFAINETYRAWPFLGYGTDWLAFGHLVIALFSSGRCATPCATFGSSTPGSSPAPVSFRSL